MWFWNDWASSLTLGFTGILDASHSHHFVLYPHCVAEVWILPDEHVAGAQLKRSTHCESTHSCFQTMFWYPYLVANTMCCIKIHFRKFNCWTVSSTNSKRNEPPSIGYFPYIRFGSGVSKYICTWVHTFFKKYYWFKNA